MSRKLPVINFEWIKHTSQFNEDFIENYDEESDEGYFLEVMFSISKVYINFIIICDLYLKE